ncbi:40253_t:CDS:2 [Gigaspora margarita]|uniref:40253_t:CDS:1 n=1 Tax=Gigaspora margarita TaxID=4874 RepID=A0ABN7UVA3_GIGMA|nr:40253_t:CDS:2 [Gigaspora margarita]
MHKSTRISVYLLTYKENPLPLELLLRKAITKTEKALEASVDHTTNTFSD